MSTVPGPLSYRFIARFKDGDFYAQNETDTAVIKESGSAFSDIADRLGEITTFTLVQNDDGEEVDSVTVDLRTGFFTVNGMEVNIASQNFIRIKPLKLVYFREVREEMTLGQEGVPNRRYVSRYFIGWETTDIKGHVIQRTMALAA